MAVTIALFIGVRHADICWKTEDGIYAFGVQSFWSLHFESW
jgi:hypothetical protein